MQRAFPNRYYIDSNVWFAYITEDQYEPDFFKKAKVLIDGIIDDQKSVALISQLVYLEMIGLFRKRVTQREKHDGVLTTEKQAVMTQKINQFTTKFADTTTKWIGSGKLFPIKPSRAFKLVYTDIQKLQNQITGKIVEYNSCGICGNTAHSNYDYKSIDHWDIQHVLLARAGEANFFATFDKGFKFVRPKFPYIEFHVMEKDKPKQESETNQQ